MGFLLFIQSTFGKVISVILAFSFIALGIGYGVRSFEKKYDSQGYNRAKAEDVESLLAQEKKARILELSYQEKIRKAQNEKSIADKKLLDIGVSSNNAVFGLRQQIKSYSGGLSGDTRDAIIARTGALSAVFSECIGEYSKMAEYADRNYQDAKLIKDSWPK